MTEMAIGIVKDEAIPIMPSMELLKEAAIGAQLNARRQLTGMLHHDVIWNAKIARRGLLENRFGWFQRGGRLRRRFYRRLLVTEPCE